WQGQPLRTRNIRSRWTQGRLVGKLCSLALQSCFVNDIDRGRDLLDDLALSPHAQDTAGIFARHRRQRRQVVLANSLPDDDLVRRLARLAKVFGKLKQGASDACLERKKARGRHLLVSLPQALHEGGYQVTVDLGIVLKAFEEGAAAQKGQPAVSQRLDRG